jgi:nucleoid-associated protein YgaU
MNPRLYEKLYGFRAIIPVLIVLLLILLGWGVYRIVVPPVVPTQIAANGSSPTPKSGVTESPTPQPTHTFTTVPPIEVPTNTPTVQPSTTPTTRPTLTPTATVEAVVITPVSDSTVVFQVNCNPKPRRFVDGLYVVRCGDSLIRIAQESCGSSSFWWMIYDANRDKIMKPDLIFSGQKLVIPCQP